MRNISWPNMRWNLLDDLHGLQEDMNRIFANRRFCATEAQPPVDAWVDEEKMILEFELPGIDPDKIDISVRGDTLSVSGERSIDELKDDEAYHRRERGCGSFVRNLRLPYRVDSSKAEASYDKGVLQVTLSRSEEDKPRKIQIKTG
ncbi:MAG: Hsp20/alpha crystallin family protein [Lentisphaerae bacterium]|nr:Hsp20/alpha crystallin family protein [Lentisphaerota bacterium]